MRLLLPLLTIVVVNFCQGQSITPAQNSTDQGTFRPKGLSALFNLNKDDILLTESADSMNIFFLYEKYNTSILEKGIETNWIIGLDNFYAKGQDSSFIGDGLFSNLTLENRSVLFGLPIRVTGDLVLQNNQVNNRLSGLSVEFDSDALINNYRQKAEELFINESFSNLPLEKQDLLKKFSAAEQYMRLIGDSIYQEQKKNMTIQIDSLNLKATSKIDSSIVDSLSRLLSRANAAERKIDSLYTSISHKYGQIDEAIQEWKGMVNLEQLKMEDEIKSGTLHRLISNNKLSKKGKSILTNIQNLSIGSVRVSSSPYDVSSIPTRGIGGEFYRNNYYVALHYGVEVKPAKRVADYERSLQSLSGGRKVFQIKAGIGLPEKSHLHLIYSDIRAGANTDSSYMSALFPKHSTMITVDARNVIMKNLFIDLVGTISNADMTGSSNTNTLMQGMYEDIKSGSGKKMAGLARMGWQSLNSSSEWSIGYQTVGDQFASNGNPFLIKNRNTLRIEGKQSLAKRRLQIKGSLIRGLSNKSNNINPDTDQWQYSGELSYRIGKRGTRIWANVKPAFFTQEAAGSEPIIYQANLASLGSQIMYKPGKKGQWSSMLHFTNFSDQTQFGDSAIVSGMVYSTCVHSYATQKYSFSISGNLGLDGKNIKRVIDYSAEASQTFSLRLVQITQGIQMVKRFYQKGTLAGGNISIQLNNFRRIQVGAGLSYLHPLSNGNKEQLFINTSAAWRF